MVHDVIVSIWVAKECRRNTNIDIITRSFIARNNCSFRCCLGEYSFATDHVVADTMFT
jgi:hypothetical protein